MNRKNSQEYATYTVANNQDETKIASLRNPLDLHDSVSDEIYLNQEGTGSREAKSVGIWMEHVENGETIFVRDKRHKKSFYRWAKINKIFPKHNQYRIAFLGESVARGFLYEPYITPASVLEKMLNDNMEEREVEIIDLTCLGLGLLDLEKICKDAMLLEPDMIVIFAGNNWKVMIHDLSDEDRKELLSANGQYKMLKKMGSIIKHKTVAQINQFMDVLAKLSQSNDIPVVFVIPENNLKGWKHNFGGEIFPFNVCCLNELIQHKDEIEQAMSDGNYEIAKEKAKKLIEMDNISSIGYEYLAQCMLHDGNLLQARNYFEIARDSGIYMPYDVRCCYSFISHTITERAKEHHFLTVNLPKLFRDIGDGIPGYDLFIDYCHLNADGIHYAMKYTAEIILPLLGHIGIVEIKKKALECEKISRTYFLAALHCAHHGQPHDVLYNFCCEALRLSPEISELMMSYINLVSRKIVWLLNTEMNEVIKSNIEEQYPFFIQDYEYKSMDIILVQAMIQALKCHGRIYIEEEINTFRIKEHRADDQCVDLLESCYRNTSADEKIFFYSYEAIGSRKQVPTYKRIKNVETGFFFIADKESDLTLNMTIRNVCENHRAMKFNLEVNGVFITEFTAIWDWKNITCHIEKKHLAKEGINRVRLIRNDYDHCFEVSRQNQFGLHDMVINNLYGAHCQIRSLTVRTS